MKSDNGHENVNLSTVLAWFFVWPFGAPVACQSVLGRAPAGLAQEFPAPSAASTSEWWFVAWSFLDKLAVGQVGRRHFRRLGWAGGRDIRAGWFHASASACSDHRGRNRNAHHFTISYNYYYGEDAKGVPLTALCGRKWA